MVETVEGYGNNFNSEYERGLNAALRKGKSIVLSSNKLTFENPYTHAINYLNPWAIVEVLDGKPDYVEVRVAQTIGAGGFAYMLNRDIDDGFTPVEASMATLKGPHATAYSMILTRKTFMPEPVPPKPTVSGPLPYEPLTMVGDWTPILSNFKASQIEPFALRSAYTPTPTGIAGINFLYGILNYYNKSGQSWIAVKANKKSKVSVEFNVCPVSGRMLFECWNAYRNNIGQSALLYVENGRLCHVYYGQTEEKLLMVIPEREYIDVKMDIDYTIPEIVSVDVTTEHGDASCHFEHLPIGNEPIGDIPSEFWQYQLYLQGEGQVLVKNLNVITPANAPPAPVINTTFTVEVDREKCRNDLCNQYNVSNGAYGDNTGLCYNTDADHYEPWWNTGQARPKGFVSPSGSDDWSGVGKMTFTDDKEKIAKAACDACPFKAIKVTEVSG